MKIGLIGAGHIGATLGRHWVRAGHQVCFGVRQPEALAPLLAELGPAATAGSAADAVHFADPVLVFCAPYGAWPEFARVHLTDLKGKTVVDAANPYPARDGAVAEAVAHAGGGALGYTAHLLPGVAVVKAFNSVNWEHLRDQAGRAGERLAMPLAGDHEAACQLVSGLARDAGFDPVWVGGQAAGIELDPGSPVYAKSMTAAQLRATLGLQA